MKFKCVVGGKWKIVKSQKEWKMENSAFPWSFLFHPAKTNKVAVNPCISLLCTVPVSYRAEHE